MLGLLVFLAGVGVLVWVFLAANRLFNTPAPPLPVAAPANAANPGPSPFVAIGASFGELVQRLLVLLLMSVAGSVVASKGVQLYFAARPLPGGDALPSAAPPPLLETTSPIVASAPAASNGRAPATPPVPAAETLPKQPAGGAPSEKTGGNA